MHARSLAGRLGLAVLSLGCVADLPLCAAEGKRPNVVLIDTKGEAHTIRKQETMDNIIQQEEIPGHLK